MLHRIDTCSHIGAIGCHNFDINVQRRTGVNQRETASTVALHEMGRHVRCVDGYVRQDRVARRVEHSSGKVRVMRIKDIPGYAYTMSTAKAEHNVPNT